MKRAWSVLQVIVGLALLAVFALGLVAAFRALSGSGAPGAQEVTQSPQGYPPPQATLPVPGPTLPPQATPAAQTPEGYPPPQTNVVPMGPTLSPQPTPTRRPGPTATAMPLPTPASDASGIIRYTTVTGEPPNFTYSHFALPVDAFGQAKAATELVELSPDLGFSPSQVIPSPDGHYLVAIMPVEPGGQPYVINQTTGEVKTPLTDFAPGQFQGWHPDSRHFLFVVDGGGPWLVDAETSEVTQLVLDGSTHGAAISPDGLTVAYIGSNPSTSGGIHALWLASSTGGDAKLQFSVGSVAQLYVGAWSPDGVWIVYYGNCSESSQTGPLCLFNPSTGERNALSIPSFGGTKPAWSPNSQHLAATGYVRGDRLCEGGQLSPLELEACQFDDGHIIYIADTLKNEASQLTSGIAPVWSPDGSMLAFISKRSGAPEIWIIQADGTELQQLTTDGQYKDPFTPTWSAEVGQ